MYSERTQVLLSPQQVTKLKRIAAREGRSVGAVIRDAVDSYVDPGDDARRRARDLIHVATCIHEGITDIISTERAFDSVRDVRRIAPETFAA